MDLSQINKVTSAPAYLPTVSMSKLELNKEYLISKVKWVNTKYGKRIVAELNKEFTIFLPPRTVKFCEENVDWFPELTKVVGAGRMHLEYLGGTTNQFKFVEKDN